MTRIIANTSIDRVHIIDDNREVRLSHQYNIEDLNLIPMPITGPLHTPEMFLKSLETRGNAVICDYHLKKQQYASFNGAEMVSQLYQKKVPSILYTRYETVIDEIRPYKQYIPVLLNPDDLNLDTIVLGFEKCIEEFDGNYRPSRRPWRTLIRVEDYDKTRNFFDVVIPGWEPNKVISLPIDISPITLQGSNKNQKYFHAKVNIGAENHEELYFTEWEIG